MVCCLFAIRMITALIVVLQLGIAATRMSTASATAVSISKKCLTMISTNGCMKLKFPNAIHWAMNGAGGHPTINSRKRTGCAEGWLQFTTDFIQYVILIIQVTVAVADGATVVEVPNHVIVPTASTTPKILKEYWKNQSNHRDP